MNPIKSIYDLTSNEMEVRAFGRDVMDLSFIEKDDVRANTLSDLGYRLSNFGELFGMKTRSSSQNLILFKKQKNI